MCQSPNQPPGHEETPVLRRIPLKAAISWTSSERFMPCLCVKFMGLKVVICNGRLLYREKQN